MHPARCRSTTAPLASIAAQPDRRTRTRDRTAIVAATRIVERAMTYPAPGPPAVAITGRTAGMVRDGGASTGGRGPAGDSRPLGGAAPKDGVRRDDALPCRAVIAAWASADGGAGVDTGSGSAVVSTKGGDVPAFGFGARDRSRPCSSSQVSRDRPWWHR